MNFEQSQTTTRGEGEWEVNHSGCQVSVKPLGVEEITGRIKTVKMILLYKRMPVDCHMRAIRIDLNIIDNS